MFRRVVPGQRVHPPAAAMNGLFDLLEQRNRREPKGIPAGFTSGPVEVLVKNNTGSALSSSFSVVALGDVVINRTDGEQAFNRQHLFEGDTPASSSRIAIVQEPLSADAIGRAVVAGITTVKLNVVDSAHTHAGPTTVTTDLTTANSGPAEILWKESGTGSKWAKVLLLGGQSSAAASPSYEGYTLQTAIDISGTTEITNWIKTSTGGSSTYLDFPSDGWWRVNVLLNGYIYHSAWAILNGSLVDGTGCSFESPVNGVGGSGCVVSAQSDVGGVYEAYGSLSLFGIARVEAVSGTRRCKINGILNSFGTPASAKIGPLTYSYYSYVTMEKIGDL